MITTKTMMILSITTAFAWADTDRREIRLADCPANIRKTVNAHARGGVVDEVDFISIAGKSIYIAEVDLPGGRDLKIYASGTGDLVKTREEIALKDVPPSVRTALQALGGRVDDVEKEVAGSTVTFHADIDRIGQPDLDVVLSADGAVLRNTEDADD